MRVKNVGDDIDVGITIPSIDSTEVWSVTVIQQDFGGERRSGGGQPDHPSERRAAVHGRQ